MLGKFNYVSCVCLNPIRDAMLTKIWTFYPKIGLKSASVHIQSKFECPFGVYQDGKDFSLSVKLYLTDVLTMYCTVAQNWQYTSK